MKDRFESIKQDFLWWPMIIVTVSIIIDQITKVLTIQASGNHAPSHISTVIPGYFNIVDYRNTGAAWGIFQEYSFLLSFVSLAAFFYFIWDFRAWTEKYNVRRFAVALLIGGIFGNWIDRFFRREVIDMIEVYIPKPGINYRFPAFNIADACICVGVTLLLIHMTFFTKEVPADAAKKSENGPTASDTENTPS